MLDPTVNPLTQEHCDCLNEILGSCKKTEQLIQACENCNLEVSAVKDRNAQQAMIAGLIKQQFFPDRP